MSVYCLFASHFIPYLGGVERYTYNLAKKLQEKGNRVIVVTSQMEGQPQKLIYDGIEVIRLDSISVMNDRLPFVRFSKRNRTVFRWLVNQKIDYAVINTKFYLLSYVAAKFAQKNNIPAIVIEHGTGHIEFSNYFVEKIGELYEHVLTYFVKKTCRYFVGVSEECGLWLKHFGVQAIGTLYNAIDYNYIQDIINRKEKNDHSEYVIAYSGRIMREKGVFDLVISYQKLKEIYPSLKLVLIGDGSDFIQLKKEYGADKDIVFTGKLDFEGVIKVISDATIFCFPTLYPEGLPTCVLEAMAAGVYVITTDRGGAKEVIIDERFGSVIYGYNVNKLVGSIDDVLKMDVSLRNRIAQAGKERVKKFFTWDNTAEELNKIMEKIR